MKFYQTTPMRHAGWMWAGVVAFFLAYPPAPENEGLKWLLFGLAIVLFLMATASVMPLVEEYEKSARTVKQILNMYVGSVVLFAGAYASAAVIAPNGEYVCGIINACSDSEIARKPFEQDKWVVLNELLFNSFYVAITNLVTLGPTGVEIRSWGRVLVMFQVGYTFYLTVIALSAAASHELLGKIRSELARYLEHAKSEQVRVMEYWQLSLGERIRLAVKVLLGRR